MDELRKTTCKRIKMKLGFPFKFLCFLCFTFATFSIYSFGQDIPEDSEPPPIKVISKDERERLFQESRVKERTKLGLELMEIRLKNAERLFDGKDFPEMFKELGRFHALVDNGLAFLQKNDSGRGKVLDNFKRLDIGLRSFIPRLELIRRELPIKFEYYVRSLISRVRDARSDAVEPQFSDSVVPKKQMRINENN